MEDRTGSSGSKKKRGGQTVQTVKIIQNAMDFANDQMKAIAKWPNLQCQDECAARDEVVNQLQGIPELSTCDRVHLMRILLHSVNDMKAFLKVPDELKLEYCTVILKENV